jgi:hypothetical protein
MCRDDCDMNCKAPGCPKNTLEYTLSELKTFRKGRAEGIQTALAEKLRSLRIIVRHDNMSCIALA